MPDRNPPKTTREVRVDDPSLTPETREALTDDLRKAVGAKEVRVPADTPETHRRVREDAGTAQAPGGVNRLLIAITFVAALVVGGVLALVTHDWWWLLVPVAVHAIGTLAVIFLVLQMTTQVEKADPRTVAALEKEGISDPDRTFNRLVEEFGNGDDDHGAPAVVDTGRNVQRGAGDPVGQRTAMTPAEEATRPAGPGSPIEAMEWIPVAGLTLFALILAIANGGTWWVLPAVVAPLGALWMISQAVAAKRADDTAGGQNSKARVMAFGVASALMIVGLTAIVVLLAT